MKTKRVTGTNPVDARDRDGRTPLFYAAQDGNLAIARELIRLGAVVNVHDRNGESPLHFAARSNSVSVAKMLLKAGAVVDATDGYGNTPLSRAVFESKGRGEMIKLLLAHGADKKRNNNHGVSPEDLARSIANYDVAKFLT
jgi:uncharacterized protein